MAEYTTASALPPHPFDREQRDGQVERERVLKGNVTISLLQQRQVRGRQRLLFKHLAKAGGTAAIVMLRRSIPDEELTVRREWERVTPADHAHNYAIGLVREPCDNYVSLWSFGSYGGGRFHNAMEEYAGQRNMSAAAFYGEKPPYVSASDVSRFQAWMKLPAVQGIVTGRFLNGYSPTPLVDCWVFTEQLADTLRLCLKHYQMQGGRVSSEGVNITDATLREAGHANASPHGPCSSYFDASAAFQVQNGFDRALYQAFEMKGCCGKVWH